MLFSLKFVWKETFLSSTLNWIAYDVVSSNLDQGEVYSIMW
jgi:hypothetical protein